MIPVIFYPLLVQLGSLLIDYAFNRIEQLHPVEAEKTLRKVAADDEKKQKRKMNEHVK